MKTIHFLLFMSFLLLLLSGCAKEDLSVYDVPREKLKTSYFNYHDNAIVVESEDLSNFLIDKSESQLVVDQTFVEREPSIGDIIVSSPSTPHEDFILRKVVDIEKQGNRIILDTEFATIYQAYKSYYYNSRFTNVVELRTDIFNLEDIKKIKKIKDATEKSIKEFIDYVTYNLSSLLGDSKVDEPTLTFDYDLEGIAQLIDVHPHDQFVENRPSHPLFQGASSFQQKIQILSTQRDSDGDMICDIVETAYNSQPTVFSDVPILKQVQLSNFKFELTPSLNLLKLRKELTAKDLLKGSKKPLVEVNPVLREILPYFKKFTTSSIENIKYINLASRGAFGISLCFYPHIRIDGEVTMDLATKLHSNPVDFVFGVIDFKSFNIQPRFNFVSKNIGPINVSTYLNSYIDVDLALISKAKGSLELGMGIGVAGTAGNLKYLGIATGAIIVPHVYIEANGTNALVAKNIRQNGLNTSNPDFSSTYACLEGGVGFEAYIFTDTEEPLGVGNYRDRSTLIHKGKLNRFKIDSCIGDYPCEGYKMDYFTLTALGNIVSKKYQLKFKFTSEISNDSRFYFRLLSNNVNEPMEVIQGSYPFNMDVEVEVDAEALDIFLNDENYDLRIVLDDNRNCTIPVNREKILVNHCQSNVLITNQDEYLTFNECIRKCTNMGNRIISYKNLKDSISNGKCVNPTGYKVAKTGEKVDLKYSWFWTSDKKVARVEYKPETMTYDTLQRKASEYNLFNCKCRDL